MNDGLYARLLGEAWMRLPDSVRMSMTPPLEAEGTLRIVRPQSGIAGWVVTRIELPPAGEAVPTLLRLTEDDQGVLWERTFEEVRAVSRQWERHGRIIESAGPFQLEMRLQTDGECVRYIQTGLRLLGVRVPRLFGPQVRGLIGPGPTERSWSVRVEINHALLGAICRYEGVMHAR
ncbi:hypothetical protein BH11ARM2_BH11ARM2_36910 [soil metagenome]